MNSKFKYYIFPLLAFLTGLVWAIVPCRIYFIDSTVYLNSFYDVKLPHLLYHPYHPLFPVLWRFIWSVPDVIGNPERVLREGAIMVSMFSGFSLLLTYIWGRKIGLGEIESLIGAMVLGGFGGWGYFSDNWVCYIPAIALMFSAFLIVAGDNPVGHGNIRNIDKSIIKPVAGGFLLGLSTGFHILTSFALFGFLFLLWAKRRNVYHLLAFMIAYSTLVLAIWLVGFYGYSKVITNTGFISWLSSSYYADPKFWGPFNTLSQLNAAFIGNARVLFLGLLQNYWAPGVLEQFGTTTNIPWLTIIETGGFITALAGIGLFCTAILIRGIKTRNIYDRKATLHLRWALILIWLPLAVYSSIYVAYHSHYRLFAWAIFWWLLLLLYSNIKENKWRRVGFGALLIFGFGLWSHNIIAGPLQWGDETNNPYLVEVCMINETPYNSASAILESDAGGFARAHYLKLFRGGACSTSVSVINMRPLPDEYSNPQLEKYIWITDAAMKELGWQIDADGYVMPGNELARINGLEIDKFKVIMNLKSPLGYIYLLSVTHA